MPEPLFTLCVSFSIYFLNFIADNISISMYINYYMEKTNTHTRAHLGLLYLELHRKSFHQGGSFIRAVFHHNKDLKQQKTKVQTHRSTIHNITHILHACTRVCMAASAHACGWVAVRLDV